MTGASEGYFFGSSTLPLRSTASMGGLVASPVTRVSSARRSGWITDGFQATSGRPVALPRTTRRLLLYVSGSVSPR